LRCRRPRDRHAARQALAVTLDVSAMAVELSRSSNFAPGTPPNLKVNVVTVPCTPLGWCASRSGAVGPKCRRCHTGEVRTCTARKCIGHESRKRSLEPLQIDRQAGLSIFAADDAPAGAQRCLPAEEARGSLLWSGRCRRLSGSQRMKRRWQFVIASWMTMSCFVNADLGGGSGTRTLSGGIRSTAPIPTGGGAIHLAAGGFELGPRSCDAAGLCVTGGIVP
jgi:hypothetical protein